MNKVERIQFHSSEQVKQGLLNAGVNEQFVAKLNDKVAVELLEGVMRLLEMHKEQLN